MIRRHFCSASSTAAVATAQIPCRHLLYYALLHCIEFTHHLIHKTERKQRRSIPLFFTPTYLRTCFVLTWPFLVCQPVLPPPTCVVAMFNCCLRLLWETVPGCHVRCTPTAVTNVSFPILLKLQQFCFSLHLSPFFLLK